LNLPQVPESSPEAPAPASTPPLQSRLVAKTVLAIAGAVLYLPLMVKGYSLLGVDDGFRTALYHARMHRLIFGRDIVVTFGPLGFLYSRAYYPGIFEQTLALWASLGAVSALGLHRLAEYHIRRFAWQVVWTAACILLLSVCTVTETAYWALFGITIALHLSERRGPHSPTYILLHGSIAVIALIKFTFFVVAIWVVLCLSVETLLARKRPPVQLIAFVLCMIAAWALLEQPLGAFPDYLQYSVEIAAYYPQAMSYGFADPVTGSVAMAFYIAAVGLFLVLVWRSARAMHPWSRFVLVMAFAGMFFILFRVSFVRWSGLGTSSNALLAAAVIMSARFEPRGSRTARVLASTFIVTLLALTSFARVTADANPVIPLVNPGVIPVFAFDHARNVAHAIIHPNRYAEAYEKSMARVRGKAQLARPRGRTDVYFGSQVLAPAFELDYAPRPTLQSYVAYTPSLLTLNADYLASPNAPDSIVVRFDPIDDRLPSQDDSLSWLRFMGDYAPRERSTNTITLERREGGRATTLERLSEHHVRMGEEIALPEIQDGPIWMEVHTSPTLTGRVASFLVNPNQLRIAIRPESTSGFAREYRLIPEIAQAGFLVSPHVADVEGLEGLLLDAWRHEGADAVRSASVREISAGPRCYADAVYIVLYRIRVSDQ
jgi:hypothetical protein